MWKSRAVVTSYLPFVLLGLALLIALGFEFVNGFHDTANAVATVIYTHSLTPGAAILWSGLCNFTGVLLSSGAVAFGIISLLPMELILQASSGNGFAMIYALLFSAIIWNLGTVSRPALLFFAYADRLDYRRRRRQRADPRSQRHGRRELGSGGECRPALLFSPLVGFISAALLLLAMKSWCAIVSFIPRRKAAAAAGLDPRAADFNLHRRLLRPRLQ